MPYYTYPVQNQFYQVIKTITIAKWLAIVNISWEYLQTLQN